VFAVVRHPDIETPGIIPATALGFHRARGWVRISEFMPEPSDFHIPDFAEVFADLDEESEPTPKTRQSRTRTEEKA